MTFHTERILLATILITAVTCGAVAALSYYLEN